MDKYARRKCNPTHESVAMGPTTENGAWTAATAAHIDQQMAPLPTGQWQPQADYSECLVAPSSGANGDSEPDVSHSGARSGVLDPTDYWVSLET